MSETNIIKKQETVHNHINTFENEEIFIKIKNRNIINDILNDNTENIISSLSSDVGLILASEFDDLPTHTINFKTNIKKIIGRSINNIKVKNEKIVFTDLNLYSMLFIRKDSVENSGVESIVADKIIEDFKNHKYNILIGTQMISKGLNFKDVTLVGVINADASLNIPDFRSSERTFELLTQTGGRTGDKVLRQNPIFYKNNIFFDFDFLKAKEDY